MKRKQLFQTPAASKRTPKGGKNQGACSLSERLSKAGLSSKASKKDTEITSQTTLNAMQKSSGFVLPNVSQVSYVIWGNSPVIDHLITVVEKQTRDIYYTYYH